MKRLLLYVLAAALVAGFCRLGNWQWQRGLDKQRMLDAQAQVLARRRAEPLALLADASGLELAWTEGRGRFRAAPVLLLDNQRRGDAVGVHVLRVFEPTGGRAVLVDLGWLPLPPDRTLPTPAPIAGDQVIRGLFGPPPSSGLRLGPDHTVARDDAWLLTRVEVPALAAALRTPLAPRVLRLDPDLPLGYARDLVPLANTLPPERHRGYAVQWYALAFATVVTTLYLTLRRRPAAAGAKPDEGKPIA
jgi:cytochrome oxidase assembly protein ShyY1